MRKCYDALMLYCTVGCYDVVKIFARTRTQRTRGVRTYTPPYLTLYISYVPKLIWDLGTGFRINNSNSILASGCGIFDKCLAQDDQPSLHQQVSLHRYSYQKAKQHVPICSEIKRGGIEGHGVRLLAVLRDVDHEIY